MKRKKGITLIELLVTKLETSPIINRCLHHNTLFTLTALASSLAVAAPGQLANVPLFATNAVKPNIMLVLDDSGSMDAEVLFPTNDGATRLSNKWFYDPATDKWWNGYTFVEPKTGELIYGGTRYDYLFPNGTGSGNRVYSGRHAVPPLPQYAFARSSDYNLIYYNPDLTYKPWPAGSYTDIDPTKAPSDPAIGNFTFNLTGSIANAAEHHVFRMYKDMVIPKGTRYRDWSSGSWVTATTDRKLDKTRDVPISYKPATYYRKVTAGTYSVADLDGGEVLGDCAATNSDHYAYFHASPGDFVSTSVDALGLEGECLKKTEIAADTAEMQNFANWFSYYRKRHLALRAGVGSAFKGTSGIRVGMFTINNRPDVTMMDFDTESSTFFSKLYNIGGKSASTPNRQALKHAGDQFKRNGIITEACQRNYTIQFTDGFTNSFGSVSGANNADGDKGTPYADGYSNTMADFAMKYYTENLRPDLAKGKLVVPKACDDPNPDPWLDCNKNLHMNTITVGLGVAGEIFGQTHSKVADAYKEPYPTWPSVDKVDLRQFDDLYHAAVNGRGEIYNAATAYELGEVMREALKYVKAGEGAGSAASFNSTEQDGDKKVFVGLFNTGDWSGDFKAFAVDGGEIQSTVSWSAAEKLKDRSFSSRNIVTYNGSRGVAFEWGNLSPEQQADLKMNPDGTSGDEAIGRARLDYIMGDHSEEASNSGATYDFRDRSSRLGDIVHSQSVYVSYGGEDLIFVGANDGMLHAFIAEGDNAGKEAFAYIPKSVFSSDKSKGLHYLTDPYYRHRYYVDLTPTVAKVGDKTYLVGGLRGGGRGIFALDITDGVDFDKDDDVLWEFTHADLNYTYSNITLAKMNDGQWAAIFGNGYCDAGDACGEKAKLFIVSLETGSLIKEIATGPGSLDDPNGLSTPGVADLDANGTADWVYAGDLFGNLWAFDLTSENSDEWKLAYDNALFETADDQPITSEPMIVKHPQVYDNPLSPAEFHARTNDDTNYPNTLVLFGTGQYLIEGDKTSAHEQAFYGIWDDGSDAHYPLTQAKLQAQTELSGVAAGYRALTHNKVNYQAEEDKQYGWYLSLGEPKERVINRATVRNNVVFFDTIIPSDSVCDYGGSGYLMAVSLLNGGSTQSPEFDIDDDRVVDETDEVSINNDDYEEDTIPPSGRYHEGGMPVSEIMDNDIVTNDTNQKDTPPEQTRIRPARQGRLSWQELEN